MKDNVIAYIDIEEVTISIMIQDVINFAGELDNWTEINHAFKVKMIQSAQNSLAQLMAVAEAERAAIMIKTKKNK